MPYIQDYLVALGSNLGSHAGDASATIRAAIQQFEANSIQLKRVSRYLATAAFPEGNGPDYVNAVVLVSTDLTPKDLLSALHEIEQNFDRERINRWGARSLDLDLLACGDLILPGRDGFKTWHDLPPDQQMTCSPDELILPHPRMQDRGFVLVPLCDIDAKWRHPILNRTALELLHALPEKEQAEPRPI